MTSDGGLVSESVWPGSSLEVEPTGVLAGRGQNLLEINPRLVYFTTENTTTEFQSNLWNKKNMDFIDIWFYMTPWVLK